MLEDNTSKFGTLVQLQKPMQLCSNLAYYFQAGRTIFKAQVEKESGFWERMLTSKEVDCALGQKLELLDPNGVVHGRLTNDEVFDKIGKFCG